MLHGVQLTVSNYFQKIKIRLYVKTFHLKAGFASPLSATFKNHICFTVFCLCYFNQLLSHRSLQPFVIRLRVLQPCGKSSILELLPQHCVPSPAHLLTLFNLPCLLTACTGDSHWQMRFQQLDDSISKRDWTHFYSSARSGQVHCALTRLLYEFK